MVKLGHMEKAVKSLWNDRVTIVGSKSNTDNSPFDDEEDTTIIENEPAKLIMKGLKPNQQNYFGNESYDAKLLLSNSIEVPAGCDIYVTDINGNKSHYKYSSKGYTGYITHQEIAISFSEKA